MAGKVMIYSTPACPHCIRTKQFLRDNGVDFEDIDVSSDRDRVEEMVKKSGQMGVPVLDIEGKIIVGFDSDAISEALAL